MEGLVGGPDEAEVGVAVEHAQEQVGVAGLAEGEEPDRLAEGRIERLRPRA